jgi:hypothetical protein
MTILLSSPESHSIKSGTKHPPLRHAWTCLTFLAARIGRTLRQPRLSARQLRDIGLHQGDIDWLRLHGSSQDAATELAIRANRGARNW